MIEKHDNKKEPFSVKTSLLTATSIGKHFEISANRTNSILSELGWIKKDVKGWKSQNRGKEWGAYKRRTGPLEYLMSVGLSQL